MKTIIARRLLPLLLVYLFIENLERIITLWQELQFFDTSLVALLKIFVFGSVINVLEFIMITVVFSLFFLVLPRRFNGKILDKTIYVGLVFFFMITVLFEEVSEVLFWEEFSSRFNFIAVDYLIYTKEVIGNIQQSYPMPAILSGVLLAAIMITVAMYKRVFAKKENVPATKVRALQFVSHGALATVAVFLFNSNLPGISDNRYNNELARNGTSAFVYAFFHNELDYRDFYLQQDQDISDKILREQLAQENAVFVNANGIERKISTKREEKTYNLVVVVMESMGSNFLNENCDSYKGFSNLTSNLSALSKEGVFFPNTFATGTRTVRGLEAIALSVPPLPGMSIVRRKGNDNLSCLSTPFLERGYDCKFIYGGYGYFDNMNAFFEKNGFRAIDRVKMKDDEITFSNVWGVCDENLFAKTIKEANQSAREGKRFLSVVLTTSNHRPFTYPENTIEIPSKSGRAGGVKYADFAVGEFIKEAKKQTWFNDTIFVFIADHGAGTAGDKELNPEEHQIPFIVYAPKIVAPRRVETTISQIDAASTILGLFDFSYTSKNFGRDVLSPNYASRYFVSNYQKVGYIRGENMLVLKPVKEFSVYQNGKEADNKEAFSELCSEAIGYYETATQWREILKNETITTAEQR